MSAARSFDPANNNHFAAPEEVFIQIDTISEAADAIGIMLHGLDSGNTPSNELMGSLFFTLAIALKGAKEGAVFVSSGRPR